MQLAPQSDDIMQFLESSDIIDFGRVVSCEITKLSHKIAANSKDEIDYVKNAFEYVRDTIAHSADIDGKIVKCPPCQDIFSKS